MNGGTGDAPGYGFVPLPDQVASRRRAEATFSRRIPGTIGGRLGLTFRALQPIHIGSGHKLVAENGQVVRAAARSGGGLCIPGSSMKGALRSRYEAITLSCAGQAPRDGKVRSQSHADVRFATLDQKVRDQKVLRGCRAAKSGPFPLCPACALMGLLSMRSRVTVADFTAVDEAKQSIAPALTEMPAQFEPRLHHIGQAEILERPRRDGRGMEKVFNLTALHGRKFAVGPIDPELAAPAKKYSQAVEVIPAGAHLVGELRFFNLLPAELGGIMTALGLEPRAMVKLGAGKCHGFGAVALQSITPELTDHRGRPWEEGPGVWREAFVAWSDRFALGEDTLASIHQGDC